MNNCKADCPLCGGVGWISTDVGVDDPDFGKLKRCPNAPKDYWSTGLSSADWNISFDELIPNKETETMRKALTDLLERGKGMLYIYGNFGIGKTHCAKAATIQAVNKGYEARYLRHNQLIDDLRRAYDEDKGQSVYRERLDAYKSLRFLAIDEFGRERMNDFSVNAFSEIYDARYEGAIKGRLMTVIISNYDPETTMDKYMQDRARDRRCSVIELKGISWRRYETK